MKTRATKFMELNKKLEEISAEKEILETNSSYLYFENSLELLNQKQNELIKELETFMENI